MRTAANDRFTINGSALKTSEEFDYETLSTYSVRVRTTDSGGLFFENVYSIHVVDVNEAPTDTSLSSSEVNENEAPGAAVGTLSAVDADNGETFAYSLASGEGSADNGKFTVVGNAIMTAEAFNYEAKSRS